MGKEGQDPVETTRSDPASDPRDDWLGQGRDDDLEWFPESPSGQPASGPSAVDGDGRPTSEAPASPSTIRRRREVLIVVAVLAVVALVIGAIVAIGGTGGGGSP